jgi:hypothetical protein
MYRERSSSTTIALNDCTPRQPFSGRQTLNTLSTEQSSSTSGTILASSGPFRLFRVSWHAFCPSLPSVSTPSPLLYPTSEAIPMPNQPLADLLPRSYLAIPGVALPSVRRITHYAPMRNDIHTHYPQSFRHVASSLPLSRPPRCEAPYALQSYHPGK